MTMTESIRWANVTCVVSIKDVVRKCGLHESWLSDIVGDPELEPWFFIECRSYLDEPPRWQVDKTMVITKDGESYHRVLDDCFLGPKENFSPNEQSIIQGAIKEYVKQQVE